MTANKIKFRLLTHNVTKTTFSYIHRKIFLPLKIILGGLALKKKGEGRVRGVVKKRLQAVAFKIEFFLFLFFSSIK